MWSGGFGAGFYRSSRQDIARPVLWVLGDYSCTRHPDKLEIYLSHHHGNFMNLSVTQGWQQRTFTGGGERFAVKRN